MGVDINITTSKPGYFAGETVKGTLTVNVTHSDGASADELFLELKGKTSSHVMHRVTRTVSDGPSTYTTTDHVIISQSKDILEYDLQLAKFGGRAEFGNHVFHFALVLPINLPSSMKETSGDGGNCSIEYYFKGKLKRPGLLNFDAKDEHEIEVFARPKLYEPRPVLAGPHSTVVKSCFCFTSGSMSLGFQADRTVLSRNEVLGVTVVARNDSSQLVRELVIELCQDTKWTAHGMTETKKRKIASIKVSGSQLGEVGTPAEKGSDRGRSLGVVSNAARNELEELLISGAGVRHELVVPEDCSDTMDSELILVRHSIKVKLKTLRCVNSPNVWTSAVVQRMGEAVSDGATEPMAVATATPTNPHAVGLDAQGNPIPVLVPEDSLKFELNAIPDSSVPPPPEYSK